MTLVEIQWEDSKVIVIKKTQITARIIILIINKKEVYQCLRSPLQKKEEVEMTEAVQQEAKKMALTKSSLYLGVEHSLNMNKIKDLMKRGNQSIVVIHIDNKNLHFLSKI